MKYVKKLVLNRKDPTSNRFAVTADDRIVTTSKVSLQLPTGSTGQRPSPVVGQVRFNNTLNETEVYNNIQNSSNNNSWDTPWERVKTNRQGKITVQELGTGDSNNTIFGPLSYNVSLTKPQNVMVYIDNVWQAPTRNYSLTDSSGATTVINSGPGSVSPGSSTIPVSTTTNILVGMSVSAAPGLLQNGTTVTNVNNTLSQISISLSTANPIANGTPLTFNFTDGTFVSFNGPVMYGMPVTTMLGFDGYAPPNS